MNPLDDREVTKWAMRAGLTRDEIRRAVREGLDAGDLSWPTVGETDRQRWERFNTVRDYLEDRYLASYDDFLKQVSAMNAQRGQIDPAFNPERPVAL